MTPADVWADRKAGIPELLPCPFCGCDARLYGGPEAQEGYSVWCLNDRGKRHWIEGGMNRDAIIAEWNTRADLHAARIAALEAQLANGSFYQEKDIDAMQDKIAAWCERVEVLSAALTAATERAERAEARAERLRTLIENV
jgi:uncharacterized coiled-coil protein SlyX